MSGLAPVFRNLDTSAFLRAVNPDPLLYGDEPLPAVMGAPFILLERAVSVLSGELTFTSLLDRAVEQDDFLQATRALARIEQPEPELGQRVEQRWQRAVAQVERDAKAALREIEDTLREADLSEAHEWWLTEQMQLIEDIDASALAGRPSILRARQFAAIRDTIAQVSGACADVKSELAESRKRARVESLELGEDLCRALFSALKGDDVELHAYATRLLPVVPRASIASDIASLRTIETWRDGESAALRAVLSKYQIVAQQPVRKRPRVSAPDRGEAPLEISGLLSQNSAQEIPSPSATDRQQVLDADDRVRVVRDLANRRPFEADVSRTMLGLASALPDQDHLDRLELFAEALRRLALGKLRERQYNRALDMFHDALQCAARAAGAGRALPLEERRSYCGMLLANWIPKVGDDEWLDATKRSVDQFMEDPALILRQLRQEDRMEVVEQFWELIRSAEVEEACWRVMTEAGSDDSWRALLLPTALRPAQISHAPERCVRRLIILLDLEDDDEAGLEEEIRKTFHGIARAGASERGVVPNVDRLVEQLAARTDEVAPQASAPVRDAGLALLEALKGTDQRGEKPLVNARPVGNKYRRQFIDSKFDLFIGVSIQDESAPVHSLAVEVALEGKPSGLSLRTARKEIGSVSPGGYYEIRYTVRLERGVVPPNIVTVRVGLTDGVQPLAPSDSKRRFKITFVEEELEAPHSPYVTGDPLDAKSHLFVGRDKDIRRVLRALEGPGQDNLPLVIGIRRIGKTSLLKHLAERAEIRARYVPVVVDLQPMAESMSTVDLLLWIAGDIAEAVEESGLGRLPLDREAFRDTPLQAFTSFTKRIDKLPRDKRVLLLFDEFEKLVANMNFWHNEAHNRGVPIRPQEGLVEVMAVLRSALHHTDRLSYVICGTPTVKKAFRGEDQRLFGNMLITELGPLLPDDARTLYEQASDWYEIDPNARQELEWVSGLQPYLLQVTLHYLFGLMVFSGRDVATRTDIRRVVQRELQPNAQFFSHFLDIIEENEGDRDLLWALAVAHNRHSQSHRRDSQRFVTIDEIAGILRSRRVDWDEPQLMLRLERLRGLDVGLVTRARNDTRRWRLTVGMLGDYLLQERE